MIFHNVEPRSPEWEALRLGKIGSSEFHKILTPAKMLPSAQRFGLMHRIIAERITGIPVENAGESTKWMDRGTELEDQARIAYEVLADQEVSGGGLFVADDGVICCSPDSLVGEDGDLEIKCPLIQTQVGYALNGLEDEYSTQIQGRMMIHGRRWVDIFSYHPALSLPPLRIRRDEAFISKLRPAVDRFRDDLLEAQLRIEQKFGPFRKPVAVEFTKQIEAPDPHGVSDEDVEEILRAQREAQA